MTDINDILAEREKTHGSYEDHARTYDALKSALSGNPNLSLVMQDGLDHIASKLARVSSGDPFETDHWDDIAGYATLVSRSIKREQETAEAEDDSPTCGWP